MEQRWETKHKRGRVKNTENAPPKLRPRDRVRPNAVLVKQTSEPITFADAVRRFKERVDKEKVGGIISKIRQTKTGEVLIELQKGAEPREIEAAIAASLGDEVAVQALQQTLTLNVRDIDVDTTKEEVAEAFKAALKDIAPEGEVAVKALRPAFKGTQLTVVTLSTEAAQVILKEGKIRIG